MNPVTLKKLLQELHDQKLTPKEAFQKLKTLPYENLDFARIDHHRSIRSGMPEVIYCEGKTSKQLSTIIKKIYQAGNDILATRLNQEIYNSIKNNIPKKALYNSSARTLVIQKEKRKKKYGLINIVSAGTSDIPVAEEAAITAEMLGSNVERIFDVGVAGIHRLIDKIELIRRSRVIIAVAGMEGALVSVVGGLVDCPVIAVPTSVGYGASFAGISALLTMLNSCATGVATVNIDNGFGAGCIAHRINLLGETEGG